MHKHFTRWVVLVALILIVGFSISRAGAVNSSNWITSSLTVQKQADTASVPVTLAGYGNVDCAKEDVLNCSVPTNYGAATSNSTVRFNSSSSFVPVTTYMDGRQHFFPIPNSDTAISYYSGPVYGLNLAFNYSFASSITKTTGSYTINHAPDGKLADKAKHLLPADIASASFSENGRWMVISSPNLAVLRVDLQTFQVLPFAPGFNYTIGLDPAVKTAVSNDGRYAVVASNNFVTFKVYDLESCASVPDTITGSINCQFRDLRSFMQGTVPGFNSISQARFMNDDTLAAYATYRINNDNKTARFIISDSGIAHQHDLLALGDSYISGEGAFDYVGGTDTASNKCHVSYLAYPYLIGKDLNYSSYHSIACSGAKTKDITDTSGSYIGQADRIKRADQTTSGVDSIIASFSPGYIDQLDFVKTYQPQVVALSIGGNDMGFSKILKSCVNPENIHTCYNTYEDRLELVRQINTIVYPRLLHTYQQIKSVGPPDMRVYVIGYPQIAKPGGNCGLNVHLNAEEVQFSQELINYLDTVIQDAAAKAGVYYVDTQDSFYGFRLCEAGPGAIAVNGLTAGNDQPSYSNGPLGDESYHPNATGYQLLENKILALTHNLTIPLPDPTSLSTLPPEDSLEILDVPHSGRAVNTTIYGPDIAPDIAYQQTSINVLVSGSEATLPANSTLRAELHSTPISLGSYVTDGGGNLSAQIIIPSTAPTGYHTLHFYGTNLLGQSIDIYKDIYIARSSGDLDGDGILDSTQQCIGVPASGQDFDQDRVDDACDPNITQPPIPESIENKADGPAQNTSLVIQQANATQATAAIIDEADFAGVDTSETLMGMPRALPVYPEVLSITQFKPSKADSTSKIGSNPIVKSIFIGSLLILLGSLVFFFSRRA